MSISSASALVRKLVSSVILLTVLTCAIFAAPPTDWWSIKTHTNNPALELEPVLGEGWETAWSIVRLDSLSIERDSVLKMSALVVTGKATVALSGLVTYPADIEVSAWIRLQGISKGAGASAIMEFAQKPGISNRVEGFRLSLARAAGAQTIVCAVSETPGPFHDVKALSESMDWAPNRPAAMTYYPRAFTRFLPGWPEDMRRRIEADMAEMPPADERWLAVRAELAQGWVRFYVDDRLVACKRAASLLPSGSINLKLASGSAMADLRVKPLAKTPGFLPVPIAGYANARFFLGKAGVNHNSLPPSGSSVLVGATPMVFPGINPEGRDHLDIGRSFMRQGNMTGYIQSDPHGGSGLGDFARWAGAARRDPTRIQIRIPNGVYDALYVAAAADADPDEVPVLTAMFYRPSAGFPESFEASVPGATISSGPDDAVRLPVTLENGRKANLWLVRIPLDPGRLSAFSDLDIVELELTKKVELYRSYPDPISYTFHQAGLPSSVHVYALTLAEAAVTFDWNPDRFGHVWPAPEQPAYTALISNRTAVVQKGSLRVASKSYDGAWTNFISKPVSLQPGRSVSLAFKIPAKLHGYHDIQATLDLNGKSWTENRSFVVLAPDTRSARWSEGKGAMFGYWSYHGGHYTPKAAHHVELMTLAGARQTMHGFSSNSLSGRTLELLTKHWGAGQCSCWHVTPQAWAATAPLDLKKVDAFLNDISQKVNKEFNALMEQHRPDAIQLYPEPNISLRLTAGNFPEYWGDPPFEYTKAERERVKMFFETSRLAAEHFREVMPGKKILIPWGDPLFIVPLLRAGFPTNLIDGSGVDVPNFERLPEMQLADNACHRLYELRCEFAKVGITNPLFSVTEGAFVPTEPGACSWREQMDIYNRWALIFMAYGVTRFHGGWFAFDCGNFYGAEHYGGCGIQRRIPYCDPKPAYAAFATMTDKLNEANFDGWLRTGSLSSYALRFRHESRGCVYALWTLRGQRPLTLTLSAEGKVNVTDAMNNTREVSSSNKQVTVMTDPSVLYVSFNNPGMRVESIAAGEPDHSDAAPAPGARRVASPGDGSWQFTNRREPIYEGNNWSFFPAPGVFHSYTRNDPQHGAVLASTLGEQQRERMLMPWYNILKPARPIALPGAPSHIGLWVKGDSAWGRVVYILRDAKGERWISIGTRNDYNCDDVHSWSRICFDGWRYLRFELPGHAGHDLFRKAGTTWWRSAAGRDAPLEAGDQIVDLPLALEEIIVEQRTHVMYVNDPQPAGSDTIMFGGLYVEYEKPEDATPEAVRISALRMPPPPAGANLPNPIAEMQRSGTGEAPRVTKLTEPEHMYDGTRMHVHFTPLPGTNTYSLWVGAHADGRGAIALRPNIKPADLVTGLRPGVKLYYWLTAKSPSGVVTRPSPVFSEITADNFKEK